MDGNNSYFCENQIRNSWLTVFVSKLKENSDENRDYNDESLLHEAFALALSTQPSLKQRQFESFDIPPEITDIYKNGDKSFSAKEMVKLNQRIMQEETSAMKSIAKYRTMIYLEEAAQSYVVSQYNQKNIKVIHKKDSSFCIQINRNVAKIKEAVDENIVDFFTLKPHEHKPNPVDLLTLDFIPLSNNESKNISISGQIKGANKENIFIEIFDRVSYLSHSCINENYDIFFHINRLPFRLQHNALQFLNDQKLLYVLIKNRLYDEHCQTNYPQENANQDANVFFSGILANELNEEQANAVANIVEAKNFPLPYLLFGPAGTGKTSTLVAAIEEIVHSSTKCVLVCANSNAACDEITERLIDVLNIGEMFRMYAKSSNPLNISERIKPICNWNKDRFIFPQLSFLYQFRVLVCTLAAAGFLANSCIDSSFNAAHFSHVIIDEAASTNETMSMIAITGVCTTLKTIQSSIVLAGDPKQLDAIIKSVYAAKLGMKTSFMERLFNHPLYQRDPQTGKYNQNYITQLVRNYRSHPAILHIPNALFYENKLIARALRATTDWFIGSKILPSKKFPIIFQSIQGFCKQSETDFSMFNTKEVNSVIYYIKLLLENKERGRPQVKESDIGVVSPYKLQCKQISRACRSNCFRDITIGTAETFQGQEKPVMIVSTVRTGGILGFVKEPRRLNVIITRAKCLLIIVGDPHTLYRDQNWFQLIQHCIQNKAFIQGEKRFHLPIQHT